MTAQPQRRVVQRIATRVFIVPSVAFGVVGILFAFTIPLEEEDASDLSQLLFRLLASIGFVIAGRSPIPLRSTGRSSDRASR